MISDTWPVANAPFIELESDLAEKVPKGTAPFHQRGVRRLMLELARESPEEPLRLGGRRPEQHPRSVS